VIDTFLPVYAALRLSGPHKPTVSGLVARGLVVIILAPFVVLGLLLTALVRILQAESPARRPESPPFDYKQWQVQAARAKQARNIDAARRRQANKPRGFAGSVAELRQMQGETE
jgi:hypothetical protein